MPYVARIMVLFIVFHKELINYVMFPLISACDFAFMVNFQGHAFNTFPMMGDTWVPEDILDMKPLIRNFFENTSTVQVSSWSKIASKLHMIASVFDMPVIA